MTKLRILVTDVTKYGPHYCVAGWDSDHAAMIRPLPPTARAAPEVTKFWTAAQAGPGQFFNVGNVVEFEGSPPNPPFGYPHATEDRMVSPDPAPSLAQQLTVAQLVGACAGSVSESIDEVFGGAAHYTARGIPYVMAGSQVGSLGAIEVEPGTLEFFEEANRKGVTKLRVRVATPQRTVNLSVPASDLVERWRDAGLEQLRLDLLAAERVHIRIGLARAFPDDPTCYAQVNGLYVL